MQPVNISCVSYINSAPFVHGLKHHTVSRKINLSLDNPAECAARLQSGDADIGLIPVAAIASVTNAKRISDWCIGAVGPVKSVTLLSEVPVEKIKHIYLDFQSVTSNLLCKILAKKFWNITPVYLKASPGFEQFITGTTAGVVIGDRSLRLQNQYKYVYDLSAAWYELTSLPFVFATWICNKPLEAAFVKDFNDALSFGIASMHEVINDLKSSHGYHEGTEDYLLKSLSYNFDDAKNRGMELFLDYASEVKTTSFSDPL